MSVQPQLTKENAPLVLRHFIETANLKGAFQLRESYLLKKAIDYINPEVKTKPTIVENDANPRGTALRLLIQGVHKAQQQGTFRIDDSYILYTVCELLDKELESADKEADAHKEVKKDGKEGRTAEEMEDEEVDVRPITVTKKVAPKRIVETD